MRSPLRHGEMEGKKSKVNGVKIALGPIMTFLFDGSDKTQLWTTRLRS